MVQVADTWDQNEHRNVDLEMQCLEIEGTSFSPSLLFVLRKAVLIYSPTPFDDCPNNV